MQTIKVLHKKTGAELWCGQAKDREDALMRMEQDMGAMALTVLDDTGDVPTEMHFESYTDAVQLWVPELLADFEIA